MFHEPHDDLPRATRLYGSEQYFPKIDCRRELPSVTRLPCVAEQIPESALKHNSRLGSLKGKETMNKNQVNGRMKQAKGQALGG